MNGVITFPYWFFLFWYFEAPISIFLYFVSLNKAFLQMFSLGLLVKTFFKPWKNEYRKGLVGFSIGMGIFIKTFMILVDLILLALLLGIEILLLAAFMLWPVATVVLLLGIR